MDVMAASTDEPLGAGASDVGVPGDGVPEGLAEGEHAATAAMARAMRRGFRDFGMFESILMEEKEAETDLEGGPSRRWLEG